MAPSLDRLPLSRSGRVVCVRDELEMLDIHAERVTASMVKHHSGGRPRRKLPSCEVPGVPMGTPGFPLNTEDSIATVDRPPEVDASIGLRLQETLPTLCQGQTWSLRLTIDVATTYWQYPSVDVVPAPAVFPLARSTFTDPIGSDVQVIT